MATGGSGQGVNTCAICLGDYRNPRFLPCHHTFCASCIQNLADKHSGGDFLCPICQKITSLPSGGVASFQQKPSHQNMCKVHDDEKFKFYCVPCDQAICFDCKLTSHESHETEDLTLAISKKQTGFQTDRQCLQRAVSDVTKTMTSLQRERQDLEKKRAALEKNIHNRHARIVAAADRKRDKVLKSLQSLHTDLDSGIVRDIEQQQSHKAELSSLLQQLDNALTLTVAIDVIAVAKEIRRKLMDQTTIDAMTSPVDRTLQRPVLQCDVRRDRVTQVIDSYLGKVHQVELKETVSDVGVTEYSWSGQDPEEAVFSLCSADRGQTQPQVTEQFQCAPSADDEVFSLCHVDKAPPEVWVSYEWRGEENPPVTVFTHTGQYVGTGSNVGKVSNRRYAQGESMSPTAEPGRFITFCKSPTAAHFTLNNDLSGQADIESTTVISKNPLKAYTKTEFTIQVGPHRAFDVDNTEQYFAVVEEAKESTPRRSVHLYRRSVEKAVSTYTPPTEECRPSDVCFYTLSGENVLLVTDEGTDSIHVVKIRGDTMHFAGYLSAGCPSLVQPTAITVDVHDRLWVACRGGSVLMIERCG